MSIGGDDAATAGPASADRWVDACASDAVVSGRAVRVIVDGRAVAVSRAVDGSLTACDDACPHAGDPLSLGLFSAGAVTCRNHGWSFDLQTGHCTAGDRTARLGIHRVRERGGRVEFASPTPAA